MVISIPTLAFLFIKNKQVQTTLTEYVSMKLAKNLNTNISISAVNYSFFRRLQLYDFFMTDLSGDSLLYSEVTKIWIKRFRPDKNDIHFKKINFDNALVRITVNENNVSSLQFLTDALKKDIPPEEKIQLTIDDILFSDSRFRYLNSTSVAKDSGIDLSDLDIRNVQADIEDFRVRMDTTIMKCTKLSGRDKSGFDMENVGFDIAINPEFLSFSEGWVITPLSHAKLPLVDFRFSDPKNFKFLYDSIDIYISSDNSYLDFSDIRYFFPELKNFKGLLELNGTVFGKFGDLKGKNIIVNYMDKTALEFDMHLLGMPSEDSLYMDFKFREFTTSREELKELSTVLNVDLLNDSSRYKSLKTIEYKGDFRGYKTNFETFGNLNTNLGSIDLELNMIPDSGKILLYKGNIESDNFELGRLLGKEPDIENIDFNIQIEGKNNNGSLSAHINGAVESIGLYAYNYSNIQLAGTFTNRTFDGSLSINDPNIELIFNGNVDLENTIPAFDFTLDVAKLRPYYLNINKDDPEYFASFFLKTAMTGSKFENLNGNVQLVNSLFRKTGSQIQTYNLSLTTSNRPDSSYISIKSDPLDATINGKYNLNKLPGNISALLNKHFTIFPDLTTEIDTSSTFAYNIDLKDINPLLDFFFPQYNIAKNIRINGYFKPSQKNYMFTCNGSLPYISYNGLSCDNLDFAIKSDTGSLNAEVRGDVLSSATGYEIENPELHAIFHDNRDLISVNWDNNSTPSNAGNFNTSGFLKYLPSGEPSYSLIIQPSNIFHDNREFSLPLSNLTINPQGISVDSFLLKGADQYIFANGKFSNLPEDSLTLSLKQLNMHFINDLIEDFAIDINGFVSGKIIMRKQNESPVITSKLFANDIFINDHDLGAISFKVDWNNNLKQFNLKVLSQENKYPEIRIEGIYQPKKDYLDLDLSLAQLDINTFQKYVNETLEDVAGNGDINLTVHGSLSKPILNGSVKFSNASATVRKTKVNYHFSDNIRMYRNDLYFDDFKISDKYNNTLTANGNISTSNYKNLDLNLDVIADNLNFLATTRTDNEQFYGDIFASATANINGPINDLQIEAAAISEKNTNIKLPLYNALEIQNTDFITFTNANTKQLTEATNIKIERKNGIKLDLDLDITSNSNVQLIFDPKVGDIIEASGNGTLKLEIDDNGDFSMFGDVLIQDGEYLFTLQNVINKKFRVKPGGTISWNGSPTSATINLEAIYETKASTFSLSPEPTESMKKRIPVYCLLSLQGDLAKPTISPSIILPTAEPETRSLLETSIGTDEELMRQFISLLVINNFIANPDFGSGPLSKPSGVAGVTASELLSNQLSNWLSQISNDFDIGVNYRPGDAISSDEVEVALSTQLLNDRIIFSGNLDVLGDQVSTPGGEASNIVGDFDLEFMVSNKISVKAFNRVNDIQELRPSLYTQGVGLQYRTEFNTLSEFFRRKKKSNTDGEEESTIDDNAVLKDEEQELQ